MTTLTSAPIGTTGQLLDGVDVGPGFFRESVAIGDASNRSTFAPVDSVVGLSVNVASSVAQPPIGVSSIPAIGVSSIPAIGVSSVATAIAISSMVAIGVSSMPALGITSIPAVGVSSMPAVNVSSFAGAVGQSTMAFSIPVTIASNQSPVSISGVGVSSMPAINVSSFAGAFGQSTMAFSIPVTMANNQTAFPISAVGVSSIPSLSVSSMAGGALSIGVSSLPATLPAINVSTFSAGTLPGLSVTSQVPIGVSSMAGGALSIGVSSVAGVNISTFSAGSIGVSSIPAVGVSSMVAIGVSSLPQVVQTASSTGGGLSVNLLKQNLNTTNSTVAKAGPGQVYGWDISNTSTQCYFRIFNASSAVQISTAVQLMQIGLQASTSAGRWYTPPITFSTGIYYALTGLQAPGDNTVISASTVTVNLYYA